MMQMASRYLFVITGIHECAYVSGLLFLITVMILSRNEMRRNKHASAD
jgi:heme/copper-type cytochrome/quinol oxidase subunit 3